MNISNVRIYRIEGGGLRPVLVEIETDEGISGFGEAGVAYGYGAPAVAGMLEDMALRLSGRNPLEIRRIWQDLYDHSFWAKGGGAVSFAAISAIELALWDIKGKAAGLPVHELLGGAVRSDIKLYANGWNHEHDDVVYWAKAAARPLSDGFRALKAYPFAYELPDGTFRHVSARMLDDGRFRQAIDRVKALRAEVGPEIELMLDLSGGLCDDLLMRFLDVCRDLVIRVEDFALDEVLDELDIEDPFDLMGLYQGLSLDKKSSLDIAREPDMVFLYRRAILDYWVESGETLGEIITHVLVHEIGHHFGFSDEDMEEIEEDAGP